MANLGQRIGLEAAGGEPFDHAALAVGRHVAHFAPGVGEETERARGGDGGVLLAQRAGGGIARIDVELTARRFLALVQFKKRLLGHIDLAAHLADFRHVLAFELLRHLLQRADIGGDVLALGAVAAGGGGDERAVFVTQRHRQPVDLRLGAEGDLLVVGELEKAADAGDEIDDVLVGEGVVERQHRHRVAHLLELARRRRADFQRQRLKRPQVGKARLDCRVAHAQRVVFGVRYARPVLLVIAPVVLGDLDLQPRVLGLRLLGGQQFDGRFVGFDFGFGHLLRHTRPSAGPGMTRTPP